MRTRTIAIVCAATLILSCFAAAACYAQRFRAQPPDMDELAKVLSLSAEQKQKIEDLFNQSRQDRRSARRGEGDRRQAMGRGRSNINEALGKILTPEQMEKYREYQQNRAVQMRIDALDESLELTDDQKERLKGILIGEGEDMAKLREEMQNSDMDRQEMIAKFRAFREESDRKIEAVLTADQKKEYQAMQERRRENMRNRNR